MAKSLLCSILTIYINNYFISVPLFNTLRSYNYSTVGTTRAHEKFPKNLSNLKNSNIKIDWNTLLSKVVDNILCFAWQDNNIVLALSTIHIVHIVNDFIEKQRKRLAKTSTNGRIVCHIFGNGPTKKLSILLFIDEYNYKIGEVDITNQLRESYETHRATYRN